MTLFRNGITCEDRSSRVILNEDIFEHRGAVNVCRCANLRQGLGIQNWPKRIYQSMKFAVVGGIMRYQVDGALPETQLNMSRGLCQIKV